MTDRLYPTPRRLGVLADVADGKLTAGHRLRAFEYELIVAGWIAEPAGPDQPYTVTALGRAIREVRIHEREDGKHIVAECGDPDQPRHLGDAVKTAIGRRWLVTARGGLNTAVNTVHEAREELRHMAATALAATYTTVQEGQS